MISVAPLPYISTFDTLYVLFPFGFRFKLHGFRFMVYLVVRFIFKLSFVKAEERIIKKNVIKKTIILLPTSNPINQSKECKGFEITPIIPLQSPPAVFFVIISCLNEQVFFRMRTFVI